MRLALCCIFFMAATPFSFAEKSVNIALHPTAQALNKAYQTGTELAVKKGMRDGQFSVPFGECILAKNEYTDIYIRLLDERLTKQELNMVDKFYSSPAGAQYLQYGLFQIYKLVNATPEFNMPDFSESNLTSIENYLKSAAGIKLVQQQVLADAAADAVLKNKTGEIIAACRS